MSTGIRTRAPKSQHPTCSCQAEPFALGRQQHLQTALGAAGAGRVPTAAVDDGVRRAWGSLTGILQRSWNRLKEPGAVLGALGATGICRLWSGGGLGLL